MWWDSLGVQIRVKGTVSRGSSELSDKIFSARNNTAQALATLSIQSEQLERPDELKDKVIELATSSPDGLTRPQTWWVYEIYPKEIEMLRFMEDRLHLRSRYSQSDGGWSRMELSP
jgi:pyridoxamine 5'-phosphate oxidase